MINSVVLTGRLTAAPELNRTPSNVSVVQGTVAVNRNFKNQNGEREADFINFVAWRGAADLIAQYCGKGSLIGITGRIQTRNYENQQGQRVYVTEVVVNEVTFLETKNNQQGQGSAPQGGNSYQSSQNQPFGNTAPMDISDDDLPF